MSDPQVMMTRCALSKRTGAKSIWKRNQEDKIRGTGMTSDGLLIDRFKIEMRKEAHNRREFEGETGRQDGYQRIKQHKKGVYSYTIDE